MPLTDQDIRALTFLAARCRPPHAPRWDEAGIAAAIAKVRHLHLADVALSVIRAADDPEAKTPGVIANTSAPNWRERGTGRPVAREPYDRRTFCATCSQTEDRCRSHPRPDHEFESVERRDARLAHDPRHAAQEAQ